MNRRVACMLITIMLSGLAITALPRSSLAQNDLMDGVWQLNLAKSKYSPGPAPKSLTAYFQREGQNHKLTDVGIDAAGNPISFVTTLIYDGMPHPVTGTPNFDARVTTRVDAYTIKSSRSKAGKVVETATSVVSQDGKTYTVTITGTDANGRQVNVINVFDKQ